VVSDLCLCCRRSLSPSIVTCKVNVEEGCRQYAVGHDPMEAACRALIRDKQDKGPPIDIEQNVH
jgi:hypothetical protein